MKSSYTKFLILSALILLVGGVYIYFSHDLEVHAAATPSSSGLSSSAGVTNPLGAAPDGSSDQISQDTAFLATLTSLTKIKIDTSLFNDAAFNTLNDNTVILEPEATGRPNPFAPISANDSGTPGASPVVTNDPSQISAKTAVLNGTITGDAGSVTQSYFEYGPTPTLGKATPSVKPSLIGTFVTSVSGLTSKTTYFYHAVIKAGGTTSYGDVISFTTN